MYIVILLRLLLGPNKHTGSEAYCVRVLVKLRNEIDARTFKAQLISGST